MTIRWTPMGWAEPLVLPAIGGSRGREREREQERADIRVERLEVLSEQEDWVAYLTVCGDGSWGYGHPTRRTAGGKPEMVNFTAGVHRVDATTVEFVRRSGPPYLVLTEEMPVAVRRPADWYLRPEHIRVLPRGTELEAVGEPVFEFELTLERPLAYQCPHCGARFPHPAPLRRHVQRNHAGIELHDESGAAEAEPPPEPALTDA